MENETNVIFELDIDFREQNIIMAQNGSSGAEYDFKDMKELKEVIIEHILDYLDFMAKDEETSKKTAKLFSDYVKKYDEK